VGLFADENNARNAYTKLKDAGLPATSQEVKSSKGPVTRIRVGPFETEAEADRAADAVRGLHLDAQVFKP
jgi:cell division septation protein DedD